MGIFSVYLPEITWHFAKTVTPLCLGFPVDETGYWSYRFLSAQAWHGVFHIMMVNKSLENCICIQSKFSDSIFKSSLNKLSKLPKHKSLIFKWKRAVTLVLYTRCKMTWSEFSQFETYLIKVIISKLSTTAVLQFTPSSSKAIQCSIVLNSNLKWKVFRLWHYKNRSFY